MAAKPGFMGAMKNYFGLKEGQTAMDFGREVKELTDEQKVWFFENLQAQGVDCDAPMISKK